MNEGLFVFVVSPISKSSWAPKSGEKAVISSQNGPFLARK